MYLLIALLLTLSCANQDTTKRKPYVVPEAKANPIEVFQAACTKDAKCDEDSFHRIADFICVEKSFDEAMTFKLTRTDKDQDLKKIRLHTCDLKMTSDAKKSRCVWTDDPLPAGQKDAQIFLEITCRKVSTDNEVSNQVLRFKN